MTLPNDSETEPPISHENLVEIGNLSEQEAIYAAVKVARTGIPLESALALTSEERSELAIKVDNPAFLGIMRLISKIESQSTPLDIRQLEEVQEWITYCLGETNA